MVDDNRLTGCPLDDGVIVLLRLSVEPSPVELALNPNPIPPLVGIGKKYDGASVSA